ncbi:MAG: hypothetical protein R3C54_11655 [Parvularculaceae bacterium]
MLAVGDGDGRAVAAFAFAISAFSIPMLDERANRHRCAMGTSIAFSWANRGVAFVWGAIAALFAVGVATALIGLIIIYPALGHAAWHAYRAVTQGKHLFDISDENV